VLEPKHFMRGLAFLLLAMPAAQAQVQIDVSKISCEQYLLFKVADPRDISIWLSGYYHGKINNSVLDVQAFKDNVDKLKSYCRANLQEPVMKGVETLIRAAK
jgi:acid stress chaperone HdeB